MVVALIVLSGVGLVMAGLLAVGRNVFYVEVDPRQQKIEEMLPGANCGACGYAGCSGFAAALISGEASPTDCTPGGRETAERVAELLGVEVGESADEVALVACAGDDSAAPARARYLGLADCSAAGAVAGGAKACRFGCLGLGNCRDACPFDAIEITKNGLAVVLPDRCTGCGQCVETCPRGIIRMVPRSREVHVLCVNPEKAKQVKAVCAVGCTGCKLCAKQSEAFSLDGPLAAVTDDEAEIPASAALACGTGTILDTRHYDPLSWIEDPSKREDYERRSAEWKAEEKKRKAAKKARAKEKARAEEKKKKKAEPGADDKRPSADGKPERGEAAAAKKDGGDEGGAA